MHAVLLTLVYSFGFACIVNFFLMQVRLRTNEVYIKKVKAMEEEAKLKKQESQKEGDNDNVDTAEKNLPAPPAHPLKIAVFHPDLGIGGAERLILDLVLGLQREQQTSFKTDITIITNHHDPTRCFAETIDGSVAVKVRGSYFPASIFGRAKVFCATMRMVLAAFSTCWKEPDYDVFVVDQVAATMPALQYFAPLTPILFYCHFPDQLCDPSRNADGTFKATDGNAAGRQAHEAYRGFFDNVEAWSMKWATSIVCNSKFSRSVTVKTFPEIADRISEETDIFYPPVQPRTCPSEAQLAKDHPEAAALLERVRSHATFVSINRYERNKNISLAIEAFWKVWPKTSRWEMPPLLVIAGGYDPRLSENVKYEVELKALATEKLGIPSTSVVFLRNISDAEKSVLLYHMRALLYTPGNEHFGIVPVEAMSAGRPVIAVNHGGPCESVGNQKEGDEEAGGILCDATPEAFAEAIEKLGADEGLAKALGMKGQRRAKERFGMDLFSEACAARILRLYDQAIDELVATFGEKKKEDTSAAASITDANAATVDDNKKDQ